MSYWHGDEWRWHRFSQPASPPSSIAVIESAETEREMPANARRVPFGFSRVLAPEPAECEPLLWEGED